MTAERIIELAAAVRTWPRDERLAWRNLLEVAPAEALLIAELALELGARPVDPDTLHPFVEPLSRMPPPLAPGLRRHAPEEAQRMRDRLRTIPDRQETTV